MALTVTPVGKRNMVGNRVERLFDIMFDSSYAIGGEALTAGQLKMRKVLWACPDGPISGAAAGVYWAEYDYANSKLKAYRVDQADDAGEEVPDTTSIANGVVRLRVLGKE